MILYILFIRFYVLAIRAASLFNRKAKLWVSGRARWRESMPDFRQAANRPFWMHCASHGEFEQGRPVLERLRAMYPDMPVVVSFFSPSGFYQAKIGNLAEHVLYLPADTPENVRFFISRLHPAAAVFVKYDLWYFFIRECHKKHIPLVLIAGLFRPRQVYFHPWGRFLKRLLTCFDALLVQNASSAALLSQHGISGAIVAGDPRIDRVASLAQNPESFPTIEAFCGDSHVIICGSTHREDEELIIGVLNSLPPDSQWKWIIAPHEINSASIERLRNQIPVSATLYSSPESQTDKPRVLILDTIGMLSRVYQYGHLAFIGGGFGKSVHNTLEPFSFGLPVIMGPNYSGFDEAVAMVQAGGAREVRSAQQMQEVIRQWSDSHARQQASDIVRAYIQANTGSGERILKSIGPLLAGSQTGHTFTA